jgi:DNA-binding transcriptional MerR regulator
MVEQFLSIGQVAESTGLSPDTLRFYEREGLLPAPVERDANRRRRYREDDIEWLRICTNLRASGMPLAAIRRYAELVRQGPGNEKDRLTILREHQQRVGEQIAALTRCLEMISWKVGVYEASLADGTAAQLWSPTG